MSTSTATVGAIDFSSLANSSIEINEVIDSTVKNSSNDMMPLLDNVLKLRKHTFSHISTRLLLQKAKHARHVSLVQCTVQPGDEELVYQLFVEYFQNNSHLEGLEMSTEIVSVDNDATLLLLRAATYTTTLKHLTLHLYNTTGDSEAMQAHVQAIVSSNVKTLEELGVLLPGIPAIVGKIGVTVKACGFLQSLHFENMGMGDVAFASFAQAASSWPPKVRHNLKHLALSRNQLSHVSLPHLTHLLDKNHFGQLKSLDLCGNGHLFRFPDNNAQHAHSSRAFMETLGAHPHLSLLLIRACSVKNEEARMLFEALTHKNNVLRHLDLDYNLIEIQGILHLTSTLPRIHALEVLELDDLELLEEEETSMESLVDDRYHIQGWNEANKTSFLDAMRQNFSLTRLRLDARLLTRNEDRVLERIHDGNHVLCLIMKTLTASGGSDCVSERTRQALLEQIGRRLHNEPQRSATAIYALLSRQEW